MESQSSIRTLYKSATAQRKTLENTPQPNSASYQERVQAALATLEECRELVDRSSLFSTNEFEDDISSADLQYLLVDYYIADLTLKDNSPERKTVLKRAQGALERYLSRLDAYSMLSTLDQKLFERYLHDRDKFSLQPSPNAASRRDTKVARLKQETLLNAQLTHLSENPSAINNDDDSTIRTLHLAEISLNTHKSFQTLDLIAQELTILLLAPPSPAQDPRRQPPPQQQAPSYSERLDPPRNSSSSSNAGPILSATGKPLQPFTLLSTRQRFRNGVFRPGHNLPTMTIDEYLAEEKRRGGIVEGGGAQSGVQAEPDEDDYRRADEETMKAREWDEFKEENPRGSGNTLNRG